jgi:hypothetical protein
MGKHLWSKAHVGKFQELTGLKNSQLTSTTIDDTAWPYGRDKAVEELPLLVCKRNSYLTV